MWVAADSGSGGAAAAGDGGPQMDKLSPYPNTNGRTDSDIRPTLTIPPVANLLLDRHFTCNLANWSN